MHEWQPLRSAIELTEDEAHNIAMRRGRPKFFEGLEPSRTALLVIDMQNYYVQLLPAMKSLVPKVNQLAKSVRSRQGHIVWVRMKASEEGRALWPSLNEYVLAPDVAQKHGELLTPGTSGFELLEGLEVSRTDIVTDKSRYSPFVEGTSDLSEYLATEDVTNLIICGVATNVCCETTARDAMMRDYRVAVVADAMATNSEAAHRASLLSVAEHFGDVVMVDAVVGTFSQ